MAGSPAEWSTRAVAYLIDFAVLAVPALFFFILGSAVSAIFLIPYYLYAIGAGVFLAVQVGFSGASPGMRVMGLRCISTRTGEVIGGGMGFVRALCHGLMAIPCGIVLIVDLLFPLWDAQRQTLADKMVSTTVINVAKQPFSLLPTSMGKPGMPPWIAGPPQR
ncbi:RDD family protein [Acidiferrimicrobium sp. IK]|uniref:RDD family protein n=1 Tax=Acidiferrimicrobium sp. IK TaxID=2871700 RepID=UPI0021CB2CD7|nr:RDD family protein [Acidiferrimicrobium sp. IK]